MHLRQLKTLTPGHAGRSHEQIRKDRSMSRTMGRICRRQQDPEKRDTRNYKRRQKSEALGEAAKSNLEYEYVVLNQADGDY